MKRPYALILLVLLALSGCAAPYRAPVAIYPIPGPEIGARDQYATPAIMRP